ncbi:bifunctional methylenetetrahydrofolate dehydrogenase/methenyltetrahydrofolate cyclohydrolase [Candidatus Micrarchaeota archaeon]|nr:bifunctional methylenetetrahydrofolate dehydrogenase/methenyltetrahydrofolate cyclohydrolase [Candidatus Micrarchaeota archaeon]
MYKTLSGKEPSAGVLESSKRIVANMKRKPHLVIVLVGSDPASEVYVRKKIEKAQAVGIRASLEKLENEANESDVLKLVEKLNKDKDVDGFIVQSPLPPQIDQMKVTEAIDPKKDVDGWTSTNIGRMILGMSETFLPATPIGIMKMLEYYGVEIAGKNVVVVGRGNVVGKPLSYLMLAKDATVTICHSRTKNLKQHTQNADILIAAAGRARLITAEHVKEGAYVIDVGTSKLGDKIVGDVDFENVIKKAHCSPVPGGVGPMTVSMLISNVIEAAIRKGENR